MAGARRDLQGFVCTVVAMVLLVGLPVSASAQARAARIWDVALGTNITGLPAKDFVTPSCGTDGGPKGLYIATFDQFAKCSPETDGLREIWFEYDDTAEFAARARRDPGPRPTTTVLDQPVILSVLVDETGTIQGYRIVTDPRAESALRREAHDVAIHFRARFDLDGHCHALPPAEGETPLDGIFIKQRCELALDGLHAASEERLYFRPGQRFFDPHNGLPMANAFESSARLEVRLVDRAPPAEAVPPPLVADYPDQRSAFLTGAAVDCPGCDLFEADLRYRDLSGANLSGANLEGALLHRASLERADLTGANLLGANLNKAKLNHAQLTNASLYNAMMFQAEAQRADFVGADLSRAMLGSTNFAFANMQRAKLDFADLAEARLNDADLTSAGMFRTYLPLASLSRAHLAGVDATGAVWQGANLRRADFTGATLADADLFRADLSEANLTNADLSGARLVAAILIAATTDGANFAGALMPDNKVHE